MSTTIDTQPLKDAHRRTWASGDYPLIAELVTDVGETVVARAAIESGTDVLDVAAGSGNAAIPAALKGARVIASDLTPELFEAGRRRAAAAGVAGRTSRAGAPTTTVRGRTSRVTIDPAPTTASSPIVTPGSTVTRAPSQTLRPMTTGAGRRSPRRSAAMPCCSVAMIASCPMRQSSPIVMPP